MALTLVHDVDVDEIPAFLREPRTEPEPLSTNKPRPPRVRIVGRAWQFLSAPFRRRQSSNGDIMDQSNIMQSATTSIEKACVSMLDNAITVAKRILGEAYLVTVLESKARHERAHLNNQLQHIGIAPQVSADQAEIERLRAELAEAQRSEKHAREYAGHYSNVLSKIRRDTTREPENLRAAADAALKWHPGAVVPLTADQIEPETAA